MSSVADAALQGSRTHLQLHFPEIAQAVPWENVYFAFGSGRFSYDCVECGAKCCRGYGYDVVSGRELRSQLRARPALPLFLEDAKVPGVGYYKVGNCPPSCFFLSQDGLCEVHAHQGLDAKPETCRLFPFNNLRLAGPYLIVAPHLGLCPLGINRPPLTNERSDYPTLLGAMTAHGITTRVPVARVARGDVKGVVARERAIVKASELFLESDDYLAFAREQLRLSTTSRAEWEQAVRSLLATVELARQLLGLSQPERRAGCVASSDRDLVRVLVASTPLVRSLTVFPLLAKGGQGMPPEPGRVVHALACLWLIASAARAAGTREVTYQTIVRLEREFRALIRILSRADSVMVWPRGVPIQFSGIDSSARRVLLLRVARALLRRRRPVRIALLGEILLEHAPTDPVERVLFLKLAASRLAGRIVPLADEERSVRSNRVWSRNGAAIHRWLVGHVDEETLALSYDRYDAMRRTASAGGETAGTPMQ